MLHNVICKTVAETKKKKKITHTPVLSAAELLFMRNLCATYFFSKNNNNLICRITGLHYDWICPNFINQFRHWSG